LIILQVRALGTALASLMVANSVDDYVAKAVTLASRTGGSSARIRAEICAAKKNLFGEEVLTQVVDEWKRFLLRILPAAR
jgi:predicted O-linked N-acetylglucosamine transferase (SPINDLY family)